MAGRHRLGRTIQGRRQYAGGFSRSLRGDLRIRLSAMIKRAMKVDKKNKRRVKGVLHYSPAKYHQFTFLKHHLDLKGWPADLPFTNLSNLKRAQLVAIRDALDDGTMRFVEVDEETIRKHLTDVEGVAPSFYEEEGRSYAGRGDQKKSRFDRKTGKPLSRRRKLRTKGAITPQWITDEMDA